MNAVDHTPPDEFDGLTWYVAICNPASEKKAQLGLRRNGYVTYLPLTQRWHTHVRTKVVRELALFPRYMFIGLREGQDFYGMRGVDGVAGVIRNDFVPVTVPIWTLSRIRELEAAGQFDHTREPEPLPEFSPGQGVRLSAGALQGLQGIVQAVHASGRIEVLVEFLGGVTKAVFNRKDAAEIVEVV